MSEPARSALEAAWTKFLAGDPLSPAEDEVLIAALDRDPEARARLLEDAACDGALRMMGRLRGESPFVARLQLTLRAEASSPDFLVRLERQLRNEDQGEGRVPSRRARARKPHRLLWPVLLSATAAAASVLVLSRRSPEPPPVTDDDQVLHARILAREREDSHLGGPVLVDSPANAEPRIVPPTAPRETAPRLAGDPIVDLYAALVGAPARQVWRLHAWTPGRNGLFQKNRPRFVCAAYQRPGLDTLIVGAVQRRADWVAEGWQVIETTFAHQSEAGNFGDSPVCVAVWLAPLGLALDMLERSPFADEYRERITALQPALRRAARWLGSPTSLAALRREISGEPFPAFVGAAALAAAADRLDEPPLMDAALELIDQAIGRQRADGAFAHAGGRDAVLQVHELMQLHWLLGHVPEPRLREAARRAGEWLMARVTASGALDRTGDVYATDCEPRTGRPCRPVPHRELRWVLLFHGVRFSDAALPVADRVYEGEVQAARKEVAR